MQNNEQNKNQSGKKAPVNYSFSVSYNAENVRYKTLKILNSWIVANQKRNMEVLEAIFFMHDIKKCPNCLPLISAVTTAQNIIATRFDEGSPEYYEALNEALAPCIVDFNAVVIRANELIKNNTITPITHPLENSKTIEELYSSAVKTRQKTESSAVIQPVEVEEEEEKIPTMSLNYNKSDDANSELVDFMDML